MPTTGRHTKNLTGLRIQYLPTGQNGTIEHDFQGPCDNQCRHRRCLELTLDGESTGRTADINEVQLTEQPVNARLEYLRKQIREENISYGELAELQGMADQIDPGDVELLEWAGVPEFPTEKTTEWTLAVKEGQACASGGDIWIDDDRRLVGTDDDGEDRLLVNGIYRLVLVDPVDDPS